MDHDGGGEEPRKSNTVVSRRNKGWVSPKTFKSQIWAKGSSTVVLNSFSSGRVYSTTGTFPSGAGDSHKKEEEAREGCLSRANKMVPAKYPQFADSVGPQTLAENSGIQAWKLVLIYPATEEAEVGGSGA